MKQKSKDIFSSITPQKILGLHNKIFDWYIDHKRDLPRRDTFDGYKVFLSEVMAQQTQVERVIPKYELFLKNVPDFQALAELDRKTLLSLWSGLGFNSRALRLQQAAIIIVNQYDGIVPNTREALRALPGIGSYSSGSILAFTYNLPAPVIDTNIRRVLLWELQLDIGLSQKQLEEVAMLVLPEGRANDRYNALMDYGSLVATPDVTGIKPVSKQSKFEGSPRQTRGNILKRLVKYGPTSIDTLQKRFHHEKFLQIVQQLVDEKLVSREGEVLNV